MKLLHLVEDLFSLSPNVFCIQFLWTLWEPLKHIIRKMTCSLVPPNNELHLHCKKIFDCYCHLYMHIIGLSIILAAIFGLMVFTLQWNLVLFVLSMKQQTYFYGGNINGRNVSTSKCIVHNKPSFIANKSSNN